MGWRCASCDRLITSIDDGWVEWLALENGRDAAILSGVRLIHRRGGGTPKGKRACQYDPRKQLRNQARIVEGLALECFVGPNGLLLLLSLVEAGQFPREDIVELARRVQVPGYESSRVGANRVIANLLIANCNEVRDARNAGRVERGILSGSTLPPGLDIAAQRHRATLGLDLDIVSVGLGPAF